jgi:hypothetical protein
MKTVVVSAYAKENMRTATLVFDTLRIGFPDAKIIVVWTGENPVPIEMINLCNICRCELIVSSGTTNDQVAAWVVSNIEGEVVLCDSDIIFWQSVENFVPEHIVAGRYIPTHLCQYTGMLTEERLHPSLFFIKDTRTLKSMLPKPQRFMPVTPFTPTRLCVGGVERFFDTLAVLYSYIGGEPFDHLMLNKYDHLFCSSFVSEVDKLIPGLHKAHEEIYKNPSIAKGIWEVQESYFLKSKYE